MSMTKFELIDNEMERLHDDYNTILKLLKDTPELAAYVVHLNVIQNRLTELYDIVAECDYDSDDDGDLDIPSDMYETTNDD